MLSDHVHGPRVFLATLGTLSSVIGLFLQMAGASGPWSWSNALLLFCVLCFAVLLMSNPNTVCYRFQVRRACRRMKSLAGETIDIAAGDCSWLQEELPALRRQLDNGVRVRLLCRPTQVQDYLKAIDGLAQHGNAEVRRYGPAFELYLRCIVIDRKRPQHAAMLVIDKSVPVRWILGLLAVPDALRRDHRVTYIDSQSRLFGLIATLFDKAFANASTRWQAQPETTGQGKC